MSCEFCGAAVAIKPFELVRFLGEPKGNFSQYPFKPNDRFVYLGETVQMPGHGTFVRSSDNAVFVNYHVDAFERIPDEEA